MAVSRTKRTNGDGSVYPRGKGWEAAITVAGARRTARFKTKAEAEAGLRRLRAERDTGTLPRKADSTTEEFLKYWLDQRKPSLKYSTWRRYSELLVGKAIPEVGAIALVRLSTLHLDDLYAKCLKAGLSAQTVHHLHRVLHTALSHAAGWDLVDRNVAARATPPRVRAVAPEVFTPAQTADLIDKARNHPLGALFILAVTTGVRQGELLGLRWEDIDLELGGVARIRQTVQRAETGRVLGEPKTENSRRDVELLPIARDALVTWRRGQNVAKLASGSGWADPELVFTNGSGVGLVPARLSARFQTFLKESGLPQIQFKNLRHTFATLHLGTGVSDLTLSLAMGHSRPSTTNQYYRKVDRTHQQAAASGLALLLNVASQSDVAGGVAGGGLIVDPGVAAG